MDPLEELLSWATTKGVEINCIKPARMPGRGVGIVATHQIMPGEVLLEIPTACLRTTDTVPRPIVRKLPRNISVQGLLAADLALDKSSKYAPWMAVCPTPADFVTMPLHWPAELQARLPGPARTILAKQQAKLRRDWEAVSAAYPDLGAEVYRHAWLLVNTRTFYYTNARLRRKVKPTDTDNCLCQQPVADLFNHGDEGCGVAFDGAGFTVTARLEYAPGDEVRICYGTHSGDFLLVEYGFTMDQNRWDEVGLDDVVLPRLSAQQRERLDEAGFLGRYVLDRDTVCHRTQVAVRLLCCKVGEWRRFVDGADDGTASQKDVDRLLLEMLSEYKGKAEEIARGVKNSEVGEPEQRAVLVQRWKQITALLAAYIAKLQESDTG
ncbi:hypothetical protein DL766_006534 [Monosporascus sp. MC13-8B]|uniref:SET domain-containing protein n=1 Tax=Monosporascus cannonballus TaxID=155416 RepID=A0ABY0GUJ1_9PEZI|nr:hypothetical protein DL763_011009 [Monosporascus cannonballus]RYO77628.1 hypothetical protein DL762_009131 [Monosporascus cannonballus]RYP26996.1 hypothetical protein DL766_006534 [Monosporascus sp. MC13-8B]